uniref:adenylate kinase 9-like n=1 Tax=Myxine glutinosa TaxID=7769 RepID=UPI00358F4386
MGVLEAYSLIDDKKDALTQRRSNAETEFSLWFNHAEAMIGSVGGNANLRSLMERYGNPYGAEAAELSYLLAKPPCFIVLGKPGTGALTLATGLVNARGCVLIEAEEVISQNIAGETQTGFKLQEWLLKGQSVSQKEVVELLTEAASSLEVAYYGYVLCGFPSLSEDYLKIEEQINLIKSWPLKPNVIINIKCPDADVLLRQMGQRVDPTTGVSYTERQWNSIKLSSTLLADDLEDAEDEILLNGPYQVPPKEVLQRLVKNPEAFLENGQRCLQMHKDRMQRPLKTYLAEHGRDHVIHVDGTQEPEVVLAAVLEWLDFIGVRHVASPLHLELPPECFLDDMDMADMLNVLSRSHNVASGCRWQLSRWGVVCPVVLYRGSIIHGKPEFAVRLLDKMYMLSSEEAMKEFVCNPSIYLMPPQPRHPCKVFVCGPPSSGKSTLCHTLGQMYNAQVVDVTSLLKQRLQEQIEKVTQEAAEEAIVRLNTGQLSKDSEVAQNIDDFLEVDANLQSGVSDDDQFEVTKTTIELLLSFPAQTYMDMLKEALLKDPNFEPGTIPSNGWVLEVPPLRPEYWIAMLDGDFLPNTVFCLRDISEGNNFLLSRLYHMNKEIIYNSVSKRIAEKQITEQTAKEMSFQNLPTIHEEELQEIGGTENGLQPNEEEGPGQEERTEALDDIVAKAKEILIVALLFEDGMQVLVWVVQVTIALVVAVAATGSSLLPDYIIFDCQTESLNAEVFDRLDILIFSSLEPDRTYEDVSVRADVYGISVPECSKYDFPDVPEMERYRQQVKAFETEWEIFFDTINDTSTICPYMLDIAWKTSMELADEALNLMKKMFDYKVTFVSSMELELEEDEEEEGDDDDEANDYDFEYGDENLENEKQKVQLLWFQDGESFAKSFKRQYGDTQHYCPVALKDNFVLIPGSLEAAAIFRGNLYLCSDSKAQDMFLSDPQFYVGGDKPLQAPPIRVFLLNALVSGKELHGRWLTTKLGCFHLQFRAQLQEMLLPKLGYRAGDDEVEQDDLGIPSKLGAAKIIGVRVGGGEETEEEEEETPQNVIAESTLSEDEESILHFLMKATPLTVCALDNIVHAWWNEEPFRSYGFVLDGFPTTTNDVEYIEVKKLFPDIVIIITATEEDVIECLLPDRLEKFRIKTAAKLQKKKDDETIEAVDNEEEGEEDGGMEMEEEEEALIQIKNDILENFDENLFVLEEMQLFCEVGSWGGGPELDVPLAGNPAQDGRGVMLDSATNGGLNCEDALSLLRLFITIAEQLHPDNEGPEILALKSLHYGEHIMSLRDSYEHRFQNWQEIDGGRSKWWVWEHVLDVVINATRQLQVYVDNINHGRAACILGLCFTTEECEARLSEFGSYCPVSLALHGELVCTHSPSMRFVVEFKRHFYKMASQEALQMFLAEPETYTSADIIRLLPPADLLPAHLELTKALGLLETDVELDGFCPVTYRDGKERTESLVSGNINHAVKYRNKVYLCHSEGAMDKFLRLPEVYSSVTLPKKLPPKKEPLGLTALPVLGYLEQSVGKALTRALTLVGTVKPKLPLVSIKRSALLYTACTLKAFNAQSEHFVREKYAAELKKMEEYTDLIVYLGLKITHDKEPWEQPHDVHQKMEQLLAKKRNAPVFTGNVNL